jgi:hypothetical protein
MRQAHLPHLGPGVPEPPGGALHDLAHAGPYALALRQLRHHPDPQAGDTAFKLREVVRNLDVRAGGVTGVVAGDRLQEQRGVAHVAGHGADHIQGRGERDEAVARDPPVRGFEPHDTA